MGNEPSTANEKIDFLRPVPKQPTEPPAPVVQQTQQQVQQNEWRIGLQHPHLLQTLNGQPEGDQYRYFFEFCPITLHSLLSERYGTKKYFPEEDLQALLLGISSALSFLQEKGLSHGDICTAEVFFDSNSSSFKVLDSNLINGRGAGITQLLGGKLKYLAPEVLQNPTQPFSEMQLSKNDIWCLGMVMLESCTLKQNDNLYQQGLQYRLIQDRINEVAQIYNIQMAENLALMLNFNPNERPDPVNLFNYLLEQQRVASEQEQQVAQQQQYQQLMQQQQLYQQQLLQQQQQQQVLYQQSQINTQQLQQAYQPQPVPQYLPQQVEQMQVPQQQVQQGQQAQFQQTQTQFTQQQFQQTQQLQTQQQFQQTQMYQQQQQQQQQVQYNQYQQSQVGHQQIVQQQQYYQQQNTQPQQPQPQQRGNYHQQKPSQDFMMTQPDFNHTMQQQQCNATMPPQGAISRERVPTKIIKKLVYPDGRVEYQEKSNSASRMAPPPQQMQQPQPQQQYQQNYYQQKSVLGNIENQAPYMSNEQNVYKLKQEIEHSKTLIQQYNQQKPQVQAESIEERIRKVIAQSQALRENFA